MRFDRLESTPNACINPLTIGRLYLLVWCACAALNGIMNLISTGFNVPRPRGYTWIFSARDSVVSAFLMHPRAQLDHLNHWLTINQQIERKLASEAANHTSVTPQGM